MNLNDRNRISGRRQQGLGGRVEWRDSTNHDAPGFDFCAGTEAMKSRSIPVVAIGLSEERDARWSALVHQAPAWEYKVGIAPANTSSAQNDVRELFEKDLGKSGWIFVSEHQGIFHFKRRRK